MPFRVRQVRKLVPVVAGLSIALAACGGSSKPSTAGSGTPGGTISVRPSGQKPAPVESNPPGDLPDQVAWIHPPTAAGHFQIDVPEGWARSHPAGTTYVYTDNAMFNTIEVSWAAASSAPTVSSARNTDVPKLQQTYQSMAFQLESVTAVSLKAGPVVLIKFLVNSPPNPTTGKSVRDEVVRYETFRNGTEAIFALSSTVNQDTVDFYNHVKGSFTWV